MEIKIKKGWEDVTVGQYQLLQQMNDERYKDLIDKGIYMVDVLYDIDSRQISYIDFQRIMKTLEWIKEQPKPAECRIHYQLNDRDYELDINYTNFTTSQFIDFNNFKKNNDIIGMLSVVLMPKGHTYMDGYNIEQVTNDIADYLPVTDAMGILNFFQIASRGFVINILHYLTRRMRKNRQIPLEEKKKVVKALEQALVITELSLMS